MRKNVITVVATVMLLAPALMGSPTGTVDVVVEESNDSRIVVRYEVNDFVKEEVQINGQTFYTVTCPEEGVLLEAGEPALPKICRSIIIPDDARMEVNIVSAKYTDYARTPVAPSKGNLLRTVNPDDIPYTLGPVYQTAEWYPGEVVNLREPHIQRDYRGTVIDLYAFQYHPEKQTLRVYESITIEVVHAGSGVHNILTRNSAEIKLVPDFDLMYERRYINYSQLSQRYTPVMESGDMLIITYDAFHPYLDPLVQWKRQKGIKTTVVDVSTIGNNSTSIKAYIQNFYNNNDLAWILLVGDHTQVATPYASGGASDPSYAKLAGSDNYPDAFVGRFSAENTGHVETQVERTVAYEMTPVSTAWLHKGTGIASNQGPGHNGEYDNVHMDYIRNDLLAFTYTHVDQIYDPTATSSQVSAALNEGRSIINYCGHGSTTSWSSSGFSSSHVNALTNTDMLPFIISVACVNGDFDGYTCFAEAWLRATSGGNPSGAIATYMSSINQSWSPPMYAQDEAVDLLVAEAKTTFGGLCFNGSCYMIDVNGAGGVEMYDTWHIFGDPSVQVRTDIPADLNVSHESVVLFNFTEFDVTVAGEEGALCALYHNGVLYGAAYTEASGAATIPISEALPIGEAITLTVTAFNANPYIGSVQVITPDGPYVIYNDNTINDLGIINGEVDAGESVLLGLQLKNVGPDDALEVTAALTTDDLYVNIADDNEYYGTVSGNDGIGYVVDGFAFDVAQDAPHGHLISFEVNVTGNSRLLWTSSFSLPVRAIGTLSMDPILADSLVGGDSCVLPIRVHNVGSGDLHITFTSPDDWIYCGGGEHVVAPNDSTDCHITLNSSGMVPGDHLGTVQYVTDDPGHPDGDIPVDLHIYLPACNIPQTSVDGSVAAGEEVVEPLVIDNNGPGRLTYSIGCQSFDPVTKREAPAEVASMPEPLGYRPTDGDKSGAVAPLYAASDRGHGGPDMYGYSWIDSDDPGGTAFLWVDISGLGTEVMLRDDAYEGPIDIGFAFPYYDSNYTQLYIGSNGVLTFGSGTPARINTLLPYTSAPNNMLALWWDDLDPEESGHIYYYHDAVTGRFIVSFVDVPNYQYPSGTGSLTFQAILYPDGRITMQYGTMDPGSDGEGLTSASIGIENVYGDDGLQVVYNAPYMHNNLAIEFTVVRWLWVQPAGGLVEPYSSATVNVHFDAADLTDGTYSGQLSITTNDPNFPSTTIPVSLTVQNFICGDINDDGEGPNIEDVTCMVDYLFKGGPEPPVLEAANVDGVNGTEIDVSDLSYLIDYMFRSGPAPICQ